MPESADWKKVLLLSVLLGTASLVLNISFQEEIEGGWQTYSGFRKTGAKLVNSGSLWAALAFYCGSLTATPRAGALAGVLSAQCALGTHYTLGILTSAYDHSAMLANIEWFIAGAVLCCPWEHSGGSHSSREPCHCWLALSRRHASSPTPLSPRGCPSHQLKSPGLSGTRTC
ncbi:hypothetical protein D5R93_01860 [Actinomyces lilanjuaniae]|uniref:Uncharacterized protein n=1 Tax=Actinomyces lilanjuaniae TaxID=2321394 RepID=A0ABM6Z1G0_9ACTO|nr:hypothetical protein [Actinomyces lilanjuaniae]AYD89114.1 hypothetical protein D5R93_01860 [Actinomyces lilanjuaniae]